MDRLRTEFYRNVSHELATPLTPIVGYLRMLMDDELGETNKAQRKALRAMDDCIRRLRTTLDNLIDVTGLETGKMRFISREYDFLDTVRRAIAQFADPVADKKLTMLEELPRGPLPGFGDSDRLGRAVSQLLDNAVKFAPEGSIVGISVRTFETIYEVVVADTGAGVHKDRAEKIFEPFFQVDGSPTRTHGGVGVGLAIARRVARGLGGDVILLPQGATIEGMFLGGGAFSLTVSSGRPPSSSTHPAREARLSRLERDHAAASRGRPRGDPGDGRNVGQSGKRPRRWPAREDGRGRCARARGRARGRGRTGRDFHVERDRSK